MDTSTLILIIVVLVLGAYYLGTIRSRALALPAGGIHMLPSLPSYYGFLTAAWALIPPLVLLLLWTIFEDILIRNMVEAVMPAQVMDMEVGRRDLLYSTIVNTAAGMTGMTELQDSYQAAIARYAYLTGRAAVLKPLLVVMVALIGGLLALSYISVRKNARYPVERLFTAALFLCSSIAILSTVGIVASILFESIRFFQQVPLTDFLFGLEWSPQIAIRADQTGASGAFGSIPLFAGTLLISAIAMLIAVPVGLMSAIYLAEYASRRVRGVIKPALEVLAGIPTVVYGFFAALTVAPAIRQVGAGIGLEVASESALAAGLVMGIMIIPFVSSLSDDVITAVPQSLRDGSLGLGATQSETIRRVIIPAALPGIVGGVLLAVSRAIGETMIVVMAAGLAANLTANPLEAVTTVTVQIVTLLVGDQEFNSPKTLAAFALGLLLFVVTLCLNFVALYVVRKYREQYD